MTTNDSEFGSVAREHPAAGGSIDSFTTEEGLVIYDRRNPDAWLSSTAVTDIPDAR